MKTIAISVSSLTEKTRDVIVGVNRACTNRKSKENKYDYGKPATMGRVCAQV